jgi:predicted dehydrogenase
MSHMSDSQHVRLGIIGFGSWAINAYLPAIARIPGAKVVAAAGRSDATQSAAREALGPDALVTSDFRELFDPGLVDAVMIAVTEDQHAVTIGAALDSGLPLFYEPPLSDKRSQIRGEIDRLANASGITHADLELSYLPVIDRATALVRDSSIGTPHDASVKMISGWGAIPGSDVSLALQLTPWYVDPLNRVLGRRPSRVLVQEGTGVEGRMQSQTLVQFDYDGIWATFDANIKSVGELGAWIAIHGSDGDIEADLFRGELRFRTAKNPEWQNESLPALQPHAGWPGMHESVADFVSAIQTGGETRSGAATMAGLQLTGLAAEESIDSGTWANVELQK